MKVACHERVRLGGRIEWWAMMDLNHRPRHYQCRALTPELIARMKTNDENDVRSNPCLPAVALAKAGRCRLLR